MADKITAPQTFVGGGWYQLVPKELVPILFQLKVSLAERENQTSDLGPGRKSSMDPGFVGKVVNGVMTH